jgi:hypothetical protein
MKTQKLGLPDVRVFVNLGKEVRGPRSKIQKGGTVQLASLTGGRGLGRQAVWSEALVPSYAHQEVTRSLLVLC